MFQLSTARCQLRPFQKEDALLLLPILSCPEVMRYSMTGPMHLSQVKACLDEWLALYAEHGFGPLAVIYQEQLIGYAGYDIRIIEKKKRVQLTFRLAKNYWGMGLATECATHLCSYGFTHLGFPELIAIVDPANKASLKLLAKLGMRFEQSLLYGGLPLAIYCLLPSAYALLEL